jgi:diguanylate cyclase (GGDEF)-like protein
MEDRPPHNGSDGGKHRRDALNTEQTIADVEQTVSDVDQTAADLDQSNASRDQDGSNRDRHLSDADQRASDRDQRTADRDGALERSASTTDDPERDATRRQRAETTAERTQIAAVRTATSQRRFKVAEQRDEAARSRDLASEARDLAATARDGLAALYDAGPGAVARTRAAEDREHSAEDREHSAGDRWETRLDRDDMRDALSEANIDDLTGTLRRSLGNVALRSEIERADRSHQPLVLAFVDVDALKEVNERDGHLAGDDVLLDVVKSLRLHLRSYDPVVRFASDKFVCALPDTDLAGARTRFATIETALAGEPHGASITFGFTELETGDTLETMIVRGDAALYAAKHG